LTEKKQILKSASIITLVTIVSRILGYVRDQRIALLLVLPRSRCLRAGVSNPKPVPQAGCGRVHDGFVHPGVLELHAEKSRKELWEFANRLFWTLALVAAVITVLGMVFSPSVVRLFAGKNIAGIEAVELNRIIFRISFCFASRLAMGILNCFHVFVSGSNTRFPEPGHDFFHFCDRAELFQGCRDFHCRGSACRWRPAVLDSGTFSFRKGMNFNFGISFSIPRSGT